MEKPEKKLKEKVKNVLIEKLIFQSAPEIERARRTGRPTKQDGPRQSEGVHSKDIKKDKTRGSAHL